MTDLPPTRTSGGPAAGAPGYPAQAGPVTGAAAAGGPPAPAPTPGIRPVDEAGTTAILAGFDAQPGPDPAPEKPHAAPATPAERPARFGGTRGFAVDKGALVVLVAIIALALGFIIMVFANVSDESINALAVIAAVIASMVAAYYGITLSMQQVRSERAEKEKAVARADAAAAASRETEVWAAQMEAGLRVALVKLNAAGVGTSEVTKAAGAPDDFF